MMPKVLVIIVTWNRKEYALQLLNTLSLISYPAEAVDILIVDNNSTDGTVETITASHPEVNVIRNPENLGGSGGFNTGLKWAFERPENDYRYIWLLDNDVVVHKKALCELVSVLETYSEIGVVGSTMLQLEKPWCVHEMGGFLDRHSGRLRLNMKGKVIEEFRGKVIGNLVNTVISHYRWSTTEDKIMTVDYVAAASLLVRSFVARRAGFFRDYFLHFDDVEWCLRISNYGFGTAVCATSLIWHASTSSSRNSIPESIYYYNNRNLLDLLRDYGDDKNSFRRYKRRVWMKVLFFALVGKIRISYLHFKAISDFKNAILGKLDNRPTG